MNSLQRTRALLMPLKRGTIRTLTVNALQRKKDLTYRLAEPNDFDNVLKISEGLHDGHDYLPLIFHQWLKYDNSAVMLALDDEEPIGLLAGFIVDNGSTVVWRGGRVVPGRRGQGVFRGLREALDDFLGEHFPNVCREQVSVYTTQIPNSKDNPWRRILEYDALYYAVDEKTSLSNNLPSENKLVIESCTKEYFSDKIISCPSTKKLFANNPLVVDRCPFMPLRSNVDFILREHDLHMFVEKCSDALPRSFSHGVYAQRTESTEWLATVYTDNPALFKAHLLHQFKRACEVIQGKFTFFTFQDRHMTALTRNVLGNMVGLKEVNIFNFGNAPLRIFERDFKQ